MCIYLYKGIGVECFIMLIDCFIFYNELDILKKRLKYLSPVVDKFVLVESTVTHRGRPKELYYQTNKDMFKEWEHKIVHIVVDDNPTDEDPWVRENFHRNCITRGLTDVPDDALVMISDVDEVPLRTNIILPDNCKACSFNMTAFQYSLKYIQVHEPWFGTVLTLKKVLNKITPQVLRNMRWNIPHYPKAGWHFSSFGDEKFVANKIENYAHCYDDVSKNKNESVFKSFIEKGIHADGRNTLVETPEELLLTVPLEFREKS